MSKLAKAFMIGLFVITAMLSINAYGAGEKITVLIDGKAVAWTDAQPFIENGRTLVPLRAVSEALGATVAWNEQAQSITLTKGVNTVKLTINNAVAYKNSTQLTLDVPAKIVGDRTYVPLRFIGESFEKQVGWNGTTNTVTITEKTGVPTTVEIKPLTDKELLQINKGICTYEKIINNLTLKKEVDNVYTSYLTNYRTESIYGGVILRNSADMTVLKTSWIADKETGFVRVVIPQKTSVDMGTIKTIYITDINQLENACGMVKVINPLWNGK